MQYPSPDHPQMKMQRQLRHEWKATHSPGECRDHPVQGWTEMAGDKVWFEGIC